MEFTITASNVTLDLNGYTLSGSDTSGAFEGIHLQGNPTVDISNITVRNGHVEGFGNSLELRFANHCIIRDLHCRNSGEESIILEGGDSNSPSVGNSIHSCSVTGSGGYGIVFQYSDSNIITKTTISDAGSTGIQITLSSSNIVYQCSVSDCSGGGMRLLGGSNNSISKCMIQNCSSSGIFLSSIVGAGGRNNQIAKNIISRVESGGASTFGIRLDGVEMNRVEGKSN